MKRSYSVAEIFQRWKSLHRFSKEVIESHLQQSEVTQLFVCPKCFLGIFFPQVIGSDLFYQELQDNAQFSYYQNDKWDFHEALKDAKSCDSLIEIGCGTGNFLTKTLPYVRKACGTEYNKSALAVAKSKGLEVYGLEHDIANMKASFDAVFSFHVLEHVAEPLGFIQEISLLVKPRGKICISVPNDAGPVKYLEDTVMNMPPHHATRWRINTFEALAEKFNFRISRVAYEPLLLENHVYYSYYWLNIMISDRTIIHRRLKSTISFLMIIIFRTLQKLGLKYFAPLRGQAIYVVMEKL